VLLLRFYVDQWHVAANLPYHFAHVRDEREGITGRAQFEGTASRAGDIYGGTDDPPQAVVLDVAHYTHDLPAGAGRTIRIFTRVRSVIAERPPQGVAFRKVRVDKRLI
jgi:hypothetical protein